MRILFLNKAPKAVYDVTEIERQLNSYASPGTKVEVCFPDNFEGSRVEEALGSQMMLNGLDHIMEAPAIIRKIVWAAENGYDAVIQSNTFDPGVEASRLAVRIPVIGLLRASLHFAASICDRFGLIVPLETHMPHTMRMVQTYGMTPFVSGIRTVGLYDTGDLSGYHDVVIERTLAVGKELVAQGAQAIIPLGGKIYPYVVTPEELEPHLGVPVINTKAVGVSYAELMARNNITHSIRAYPCPSGLEADAVSKRST